jgi:hypothetical protein
MSEIFLEKDFVSPNGSFEHLKVFEIDLGGEILYKCITETETFYLGLNENGEWVEIIMKNTKRGKELGSWLENLAE